MFSDDASALGLRLDPFSLASFIRFGLRFRHPTILQPDDVVAICGDSITEQSLYSTIIEAYLLACQPVSGIRTHQFGLSGETSWEFLDRIESDVLPLRPTVATTCYGMNDGGYGPVDPERELAYRRATTEIVQGLKRAGVRLIVVGSPGAVDTDSFDKKAPIWTNAEEYNRRTLRRLAQIAREVAAEQGVRYADVHGFFARRWIGPRRSLDLATMSQVPTAFIPPLTAI